MQENKNIKITFVFDEGEAEELKQRLQGEKLALGIAGCFGRKFGSFLDEATSLARDSAGGSSDICDSPEGGEKSKGDSTEKTDDGPAKHVSKSFEDLLAQKFEKRKDMCSRHLAALEAGEDITMEHPTEYGFFMFAKLLAGQ